MRHRFVRPAIAAAAAVAAALTLTAAPVSAAAGPATGNGCGRPSRTNGKESLERYARKAVQDVSTVLRLSYVCGLGGWQIDLDFYLDKGHLYQPMPKGIPLWPRLPARR